MKSEEKEAIFKRIKDILAGSRYGEYEISHGEKVLEHVLELNPQASPELQIAAMAHDIERGYDAKDRLNQDQFPGDYDAYKAAHAKRGAEIIFKILHEYDFLSDEFMNRVSYLIANHEVGGDEDANDLRDADSVAFMQDSMTGLTNYMSMRTKEQTVAKLNWMFTRMSEKNKEILKQVYVDCVRRINEFYNKK